MGAKKFRTHYEEFELDLTPLLAIIMKLVPVLVISSSFLQLTQIDTDIPQIVKQAIEDQKKNPDETAKILVKLESTKDIKIEVTNKGKLTSHSIPSQNGLIDLERLDQKLVEIKKENPQVFKIDLAPSDSLSYSEIVTVMDEARKGNHAEQFTFLDSKSGKDVKTDFLFPEVVLANIFQ